MDRQYETDQRPKLHQLDFDASPTRKLIPVL